MDQKTWDIALQVYDTIGELSERDFYNELDTMNVSKEVKELLIDLKTSEQDASNYFDSLQDNIDTFLEPPIPKKLGVWEIKKLLDTGGMSSVYLAERADDQYKMKAAVKFIQYAGFNPKVMLRFRREMQFLASLDHPNITRIIDSGVTPSGTPWYMMEYVDGVPITAYCNKNSLNLNERLNLFRDVCNAVQHAHKNLIVHRDLKPSNIFIDSEGHVKLLDFGIGKALSDSSKKEDSANITQLNRALMTPNYASPEQLEGKSVSTSTDIYSLGIILHELITGKRPFDFEDTTPVEMVNTLRDKLPEKPSKVFASLQNKPTGIKMNAISPELDDILLTALSFDRDRRYDSVEQFSRDIHNYLHNEPVMARADSKRYRIKKFIQRNKTGVILSALLIAALIAGISGILWQSEQTRIEGERALAESERAIAMKDFLVDMITGANPYETGGETLTAIDLLNQGAEMVDEQLADQPALAAEIHGVIGHSFFGLSEYRLANRHLGESLSLAENGRLDIETIAHNRYAYAFTLLGNGEFEEAKILVEQTLQELEHVEGTEITKSQLLLVLHDAHSLLGNPNGALESAKQSADLACSENELRHECISSLLYLRDAQMNVGNNDEGFETSERAWALANELYTNKTHPIYLNTARVHSNTLYRSSMAKEAIPILEQSLEITKEVFGEISFDYARNLDDLGRAYRATGDFHTALEIFNEVWEKGTKAAPRHSFTPVWVIRILQTTQALRDLERAEKALTDYAEFIPENVPERTSAFIDLMEFQNQMRANPLNPAFRQEIQQHIERSRELGFPILITNSLLIAAEMAVEKGNPAEAKRYLEEYRSEAGGFSDGDLRPVIEQQLQSRIDILENNLESAMDSAHQAYRILDRIGHTDGPYRAEIYAIKADIHCRNGNSEDGNRILATSLEYWNQIPASNSGKNVMRRLASACTGSP